MSVTQVFPTFSVATITPRCNRFCTRVMQRSAVRHIIDRMGVFNCKKSTAAKWSPHARGDASDIFPELSGRTEAEIRADLKRIAMNVHKQVTKITPANRGRKVPAVHIIYLDKEWVKGIGWREYEGVLHATHVHVGFSFSTVVKPPCAS